MAASEFLLDGADAEALARWPGMRAGRWHEAGIEWWDTADGDCAARGLTCVVTARGCRLEPLRGPFAVAVPMAEAEGRRLASLAGLLPPGLQRVAGFEGRQRVLRWGDVRLRLVQGAIAGRAVCRVTLDGPGADGLAVALAGGVRLHVPRAGLAAEALSTVADAAPEPRALGAPRVEPGQTVSDSLATVIGHLVDVMLHWASLVPQADTPEPVHQMRVATRRLRSALSIYKGVARCAELDAVSAPLRDCAQRLGAARDWDVFLEGTGARLAASFPEDRRCAALLRAARRRRGEAYAELLAFLEGPAFRVMTVSLGCSAALGPWDVGAEREALAEDAVGFAAKVLGKRLKRVRHAGRGLAGLPVEALHELRKDCKRLRYAAEFFASLFTGKARRRFLERLSDLQEELGLLNDGAAVTGLMSQLGRLDRGYAAGLVEGFSAGEAGRARTRIRHAWKRFQAAEVFWKG